MGPVKDQKAALERMPTSEFGLKALDQFLIYFHLLLTFFNMFGWVWLKTRPIHLVTIGLTAISWLGLGIWYGIGYCPLTHLHWVVRERLGITGMPDSYVKFMVEYFSGLEVDAIYVDTGVGVWFSVALILSIVLNYRDHKQSS